MIDNGLPFKLHISTSELLSTGRCVLCLQLQVIIESKQNVQLSIWDTAGQERFHALGPIYYRDASTFSFLLHVPAFLCICFEDGALLVYDITDAASFEKVFFTFLIFIC